jgi:hypothetical protein
MNIIFGDAIEQISNTHTVLELDTFKLMPSEQLVKAYCVVDTIPLAEFSILENNKKIHQQLITQYQKQDWEFCKSAATALLGRWNGELDTFYQHLLERITKCQAAPDNNWNYWIVKDSD